MLDLYEEFGCRLFAFADECARCLGLDPPGGRWGNGEVRLLAGIPSEFPAWAKRFVIECWFRLGED